MSYQPDQKFTWVIKNFSSLQSERVYSDIFVVGRCRWCLVAFPKGKYSGRSNLSLFLRVADSEFLPLGWRRKAKFSFTIMNQFSDKLSQLKEAEYWLDQKATDWGFKEMITLTELNATEGFLVNGELIVVVKVDVLEVVGKLDVSEESFPVNGFQVLPSQVESVNRLFERHPDTASKFRSQNPYMKTAYMNVLLSITQTLCQSPQEISKDDLAEQDTALTFLTNAGFELGWLKKKLDEVKEKKGKEEACLARLQETEEQLLPLKRKYSDMEAQKDKVKAELSAIRTPLSLYNDDVV